MLSSGLGKDFVKYQNTINLNVFYLLMLLHSKWCNFGTQPKMTPIIKILLIVCIEYGQIEVSKLVHILHEKYS